MYTFIDLFAGIGGIRIAFESHGAICLFSSEWDQKAQETYAANFGELPHGDISKVEISEIPNHDILLAGFPCQPFSLAGVSKKNSLGKEHGFADETQGTLFFEIAKIIKQKKPKAFLLENVKNLKSHDNGNTYRTIMKILEKELGYTVYDSIIDAKSLVPQHRERIYIVGFQKQIKFEFPRFPEKGPAISSILEKNVPEKYTLTDNLWKYLKGYAEKHKKAGNGFGFGLVDLNSHSRTLSARYYKDGAEILIPQDNNNPRRLTPKECLRLQGFPEDYKIVVSDTSAYKQFGNSVAVPIVKEIAKKMIESLEQSIPIEKYNRSFLHYHNLNKEIESRIKYYGKFIIKPLSQEEIEKNYKGAKTLLINQNLNDIFFDANLTNKENIEREVKIYWEQLNYFTESKLKLLPKQNVIKISKFGKDFPYFKSEFIGSNLILIRVNSFEYIGYILNQPETNSLRQVLN